MRRWIIAAAICVALAACSGSMESLKKLCIPACQAAIIGLEACVDACVMEGGD